MAAAHVQTAQALDDAGNVSFVEATIGTTTTGNLLVVTGIVYAGSGNDFHGTPITDDGSHTWTEVGTVQDGGNSTKIRMWYVQNITGRAAHKARISFANGANGFGVIIASEFSGILTAGAFDTSATGGPTTGTSVATSATATRAQADELLVAQVLAEFFGDGTITAGTNVAWTIPANGEHETGSSGALTGAQEYFVASSAGTDAGTFTLGTSVGWVAKIATFKASAGGSNTTIQPGLGSARFTGQAPEPLIAMSNDARIVFRKA
jgi:hypothetical protein